MDILSIHKSGNCSRETPGEQSYITGLAVELTGDNRATIEPHESRRPYDVLEIFEVIMV